MPVQKFAPMSKDFPTFDCDAHVTEPPWLWERAQDYLSKDELEALKNSIWFDSDSKQLIVNGFANAGLGSQRIHGAQEAVGKGLQHAQRQEREDRQLLRGHTLGHCK